MSAYGNDPRVRPMGKDDFEVDGRWFVLGNGSGWHAWDLADGFANGAPVGGYDAAAPTADEKIRELIGDPQ